MNKHFTDKLIITLLVVLSVIILASGQVDVEDVTDLDAAASDLNDLLDALEVENVESSFGGIDEVDDKLDCDAADVNQAPAAAENALVDEQIDDNTMEPQAEEEEAAPSDNAEPNATSETEKVVEEIQQPPAQTGPFVDIFGDVLLSLEMVDETHAQVHQHFTNEALAGKKVVGLYFSAGEFASNTYLAPNIINALVMPVFLFYFSFSLDWCGPCRQFT